MALPGEGDAHTLAPAANGAPEGFAATEVADEIEACDDADPGAAPSEPDAAPALDVATQEMKALLLQLRRRVEWHFTDASLSTDHALYRLIRDECPDGWVSCSALLQRMQSKGEEESATPQLIFNALQPSHLEVKVSHHPDDAVTGTCDLERCLFVRRRQPLPPLLRQDCRNEDGILCASFEEAIEEDPNETVNRLRDQFTVQQTLCLREVGDSTTRFYERPYPAGSRSGPLVLLATGYERVLYGDGGAYIECTREQVHWPSWPHFFSKSHLLSYYDEYYTLASHKRWCVKWERWSPWPSHGLLMLYKQRQPVSDRPWAPCAATAPHARREHGYADYRPGLFYFAADQELIVVENGGETALPVFKGRAAARRKCRPHASVKQAIAAAAASARQARPDGRAPRAPRAPAAAQMPAAPDSDDQDPAAVLDPPPASRRPLPSAAAGPEPSLGELGAPMTPTESTEACTLGDDSCTQASERSSLGSPRVAASPGAAGASFKEDGDDAALPAAKARSPRRGAAPVYDLCWDYKAGRCSRGLRCKWRHSGAF